MRKRQSRPSSSNRAGTRPPTITLEVGDPQRVHQFLNFVYYTTPASKRKAPPRRAQKSAARRFGPVASGGLNGRGLDRRQPHFPGEAQQGEGADHPVTHVDLPPVQAVPGRGREGVVVVM